MVIRKFLEEPPFEGVRTGPPFPYLRWSGSRGRTSKAASDVAALLYSGAVTARASEASGHWSAARQSLRQSGGSGDTTSTLSPDTGWSNASRVACRN